MVSYSNCILISLDIRVCACISNHMIQPCMRMKDNAVKKVTRIIVAIIKEISFYSILITRLGTHHQQPPNM